jgi:hypothetical protein
LEENGSIWKHLEASGSIWKNLEAFGRMDETAESGTEGWFSAASFLVAICAKANQGEAK